MPRSPAVVKDSVRLRAVVIEELEELSAATNDKDHLASVCQVTAEWLRDVCQRIELGHGVPKSSFCGSVLEQDGRICTRPQGHSPFHGHASGSHRWF